MGGWISSTFGNSEAAENERKIRQYEQEINQDTDLLTENLVKSIKWYHWVLYDMRARIVYATLLGCFFGIGIPLIVYYVVLDKTEVKNYGSCLIKNEFRFQCLINQQISPTEDECINAMCCWEDNDELQFKCYHYFTPAYQYSVNRIEEQAENPKRVRMNLSPKYISKTAPLVELQTTIEQTSEDHLTIEFSDLSPPRTPRSKNLQNTLEFSGSLIVSSAKVSEYFYIQIGRRETNETIFDTRIGPVMRTATELSFSTVIPTKWYMGMKGGQGDFGSVNHTFVNGYRSMELPFYLAFENSGAAHGVLIETISPFVVQYIEAPGFMFHFQGITKGNSVKLQIFPGPTPAEVYGQLQAYLNKDIAETPTFSSELPPYWALGFHLCRHSSNDTDAYEEIRSLERIDLVDQEPIPYDTDCISDNLRLPFALDHENFPSDSGALQSILEHLKSKQRRLLLSQSIQLPFELYENNTETTIKNSTNNGPLIGFDEEFNEILYPDFFHTDSIEWLTREMLESAELFNASGLVLIENYPRTANVSIICKSDSAANLTMLEQRFFIEPDFEATGNGLICPSEAHHANAVPHFQMHNAYGDESLRQLSSAFVSSNTQNEERTLFTSSSIWTNSFQNGGYNGLSVPFSWTGYTESLASLLRNFMTISPFSGTPICGSYYESEGTGQSNQDDDLCLRWFQLGLLLPFARNFYGKGQIRGPLNFNLKYQDYLVGNIRGRYKLSPYYYTRYYERLFVENEPLIRPLVYDFNGPKDVLNTSRILNQFMIGPALMAVPPTDPTSSRPAYFPAGIWYDIHGNLLPSDPVQGVTLNIPNTLSEIPLFVRRGFIIPMLTDSMHPTSLMQSRHVEHYKLLVTFPATGYNSTGTLFVDDGISPNTVATNNYDYLNFTATETEITIKANCQIVPENHVEFSSIIQEIEIVGFPNPFGVREIISSNSSINPTIQSISDDETQILFIKDLQYNWCELSFLSLRWVMEV